MKLSWVENKEEVPFTVVVLGMHRSGSSVVAHILQELGINIGDKLIGHAKGNPLGHFEDREFVDLNKRILNISGGVWHDPPSRFQILKRARQEKARAKALIDRKNRRSVWGFKDPRTSITIPLFINNLRNPYFIVCKRPYEKIANSLKKRDGDKYNSFEENIILSQEYYMRTYYELNNLTEVKMLEIDYELLLKNPKKITKKIKSFLPVSIEKEKITQAISVVKEPENIKRLDKKN